MHQIVQMVPHRITYQKMMMQSGILERFAKMGTRVLIQKLKVHSQLLYLIRINSRSITLTLQRYEMALEIGGKEWLVFVYLGRLKVLTSHSMH